MTTERTLASLVAEVPGAHLVQGDPAVAVTSVEHDSRRAGQSSLFVAIPGLRVDGHDFLDDVVAAGAAAVVVQRNRAGAWQGLLGRTCAVISVDATRPALSAVASWFYGHPSRELSVVGVTGTDGKTTTSHLLSSVLEAGGARVGRLGTVDVSIPGEPAGSVGSRMTTPEAPDVQRLLRRMADARCSFAIVESTSHGLALHRLDHVEYDVAVLTNITGDHLDFHRTFEAYRDAKAMLFEVVGRRARAGYHTAAIVNADDPSAGYMLARAEGAQPLRYALESRDADVFARDIILGPGGTEFRLETPRGVADVRLALPALFNVSNALAAAGAALALGLEPGAIAAGLGACPGVPGRMERIDGAQPFTVIVDYAHTGDAVRKVLKVLREVCSGRLIIVVGAAGERDPGRRYAVGRAAANGADFAIFTSEDPRTEDPAAIVREIGRHAEGAGRKRDDDFVEIEDRRDAIREAFLRARPGDLVVIAGKGHEQSIIYGTESRPWDDREVARESLAELGFNPPGDVRVR